MALVDTKKMFKKAYDGHYAIGAFNINNMEIIQGIVDAAKAQKSAVILQVSAGALKYMRPIYLRKMIEAAVEDSGVDVALHLDHGPDFDTVKLAIASGFTSVMFDGSHYEYNENVRLTKEVSDYAHDKGIVVEAELGKLAGVEDEVKVAGHEATYTDPDQAYDFVQKTKVDSLAVAIGTSHGAYKFKGTAKLDFDRLKAISDKLPGYPIVLHGASSVDPKYVKMCNDFGGDIAGAKGVPEDMLRKASSMAVCKINVDTDIRLAMTGTVRKFLSENPKEFDPRKYLGPSRKNIQELIEHKIKDVFGSTNSLL